MKINELEMYGYVLREISIRPEKTVDIRMVQDILWLVSQYIGKVEKGENVDRFDVTEEIEDLEKLSIDSVRIACHSFNPDKLRK